MAILTCGLLLSACWREKPRAPAVEKQLRSEFEGAYPVAAPVPTGTVTYNIAAAPAKLPMFDGRSLDVWAYNGQVPGPTLRVRLGQTLRVTFQNNLPEPSTIHWHGVRVPNSMDGVPGVTQPPVPPGGTFVYEFTPKDAGTFWFHPHIRSSEQVERGLFGVLIVEDGEPLPYSRDEVWVLDDWRLGPDGAIDPQFVTRHDLAHDGRWGQVITVNGSTATELEVRPGERIRLRLVNTANGRVFAPDFAGLDAKVIAVDGMYTAEPLDPFGRELAPGNRLDVEIRFKSSQRGDLVTIFDYFTGRPQRLAAIRVLDEPVETPSFSAPRAKSFPRWNAAGDAPVGAEFALDARPGGEYGIEWVINDRAHAHDHPTELARDRWTKLRFVNRSARLHPMHIHGQFFKVLSRDGVPIDERHWRDTVLLRPRQTIDVGLVPLDEGDWMIHCHILEHAEAGMMSLIRVR